MKKKKKLSEDELKDIFEKVYVDRTDYENIKSSTNFDHLNDDNYELIGGIIYREKKKED